MKTNILVALAMSTILFACGSTGPQKADAKVLNSDDCKYPDAPTSKAPIWICEVPIEGYELTAVGMSEKRMTLSMTSATARADANAKLSEQFANSISNLLTETQNEVRSDAGITGTLDTTLVRDTITSMTLFGAKIVRSTTSPAQGQYVMLAMDKAAYEANAAQVFKALGSQNEKMRLLFNNEKARERLKSYLEN